MQRNNRILDALETRYHKSGIGHLFFSEPHIIEEKNGIDGEYLTTTFTRNEDRGSLSARRAPTRFKNKDNNKGAPCCLRGQEDTDVNGTTMFNPDVTEYSFTTKNDGTKLS